jgi:hypothetical protein
VVGAPVGDVVGLLGEDVGEDVVGAVVGAHVERPALVLTHPPWTAQLALKAVADVNMRVMVFTLAVFQPPMSWLKAEA